MGDIYTVLVTCVVTAVLGAVIGAVIASEIGVRRTEKRLRRVIRSVLPDVKRGLLEILSDEEVRKRAVAFLDNLMLDIKARAPEIVGEIMRVAQARALSNTSRSASVPRLPPELELGSSREDEKSYLSRERS